MPGVTPEFENATYRKVTTRLLPFCMLCYIVAYLDRVNVGFAKLQMLGDLHFSETIYGLGAGMFFIGYFLFEVPSNMVLHKFGARIWIARIMITWGIISALTLFVRTPTQFYLVRFFLGAAEAGFFPGIILYLTYWYPSHRRAKMVGIFMVGIPMAGMIGGPLSGAIMSMSHGLLGWAGWKWMYLFEAIPSLIMGVACILYLDSRIRDAKWLTEKEKQLLEYYVAQEAKEKKEHPSLMAVFSDGRIWLMCWIYFTVALGQYALTLWIPTLLKDAGVKGVLNIGLVTAIPYTCVAIAMVVLGASADKHRERRWHEAGPLLVGAVTLVLSMMVWCHQHGSGRHIAVDRSGRHHSRGSHVLGAAYLIPSGFGGGGRHRLDQLGCQLGRLRRALRHWLSQGPDAWQLDPHDRHGRHCGCGRPYGARTAQAHGQQVGIRRTAIAVK